MSKKLVFGLESFMEDNDIDVEVNVGDPAEVAESEVEAVDNAVETSEVTSDQEETAAEAEMIFARFEKLEQMKAHIARFGVSRDFMAWHNRNGMFSEALSISIPSVESLDAMGDPYSSLSQACMEGIGGALEAVWEFIKKVCRKVMEFFGRIAEVITRNFSSLDSNIGRLRNAMKGRHQDADKIEKYTGKFIKESNLVGTGSESHSLKCEKIFEERVPKNVVDRCNVLARTLLQKFGSDRGASGGAMDTEDKEIKAIVEAMGDHESKMSKDSSKYKYPTRPTPTEQKFENFKWNEILDKADNIKKEVDRHKAKNNVISGACKELISLADKARTRSGDANGGSSNTARRLASLLNRMSSMCAKYYAEKIWIANQLVKSVSIYVANCTVKD